MNEHNMFNVVVAEDEPLILENIIYKINSLNLPFKVVGSATNGEDALELVKKYNPHLLFTDIKMPILDGLELMKQINNLGFCIKIIIISGYNEFDYAQQALQYGAVDYLLKPINLSKLKNTLEKVYDNLKKDSIHFERNILSNSLLGNVEVIAPSSDLYNKQFSLFLITLGNSYINCHHLLNPIQINKAWKTIDFPNCLKEILPSYLKWWLIDEKYPNSKMLITTLPYLPIIEDLFSSLSGLLSNPLSITICYTDRPVTISNFWITAQNLRNAIIKNSKPYVSSAISLFNNAYSHKELYILDNNFLINLEFYLRTNYLDGLKDIFFQLLSNWKSIHLSQYYVDKYFLQIIDYIAQQDNLSDLNTSLIYSLFYNTFFENTSEENFYESLYLIVSKYVLSCIKIDDSTENIYLDLKSYIEGHFLMPLTLESLSRTFHYSSSYITRIFKKYNGQPPIKYLLSLRMEEAKRLIAAHDHVNFRLISEKVGYSDAHYFSRLFKAYTGLTPSEYKNTL